MSIPGMFEVFATRNVALGEEVVFSYTDRFMPRVARRNTLSKYDIVCTCALCDLSTGYGKAVENRRWRMLKYRVSIIPAEEQLGRGLIPCDTTPFGIPPARACEEIIKP